MVVRWWVVVVCELEFRVFCGVGGSLLLRISFVGLEKKNEKKIEKREKKRRRWRRERDKKNEETGEN